MARINKESPVKIVSIDIAKPKRGCGNSFAGTYCRILVENSGQKPLSAGFTTVHTNGGKKTPGECHFVSDTLWPGEQRYIFIRQSRSEEHVRLSSFFVMKDDELPVPEGEDRVCDIPLNHLLLFHYGPNPLFGQTPYFCPEYTPD